MKGEAGKPNFTVSEKEHGFQLIWIDINEALDKIKENKSDKYVAKFIVERDKTILSEVIGQIK